MTTAVGKEPHWQIRMFQRTLKKKLRLKVFEELLGKIDEGRACLLVTCGDNNGAFNYFIRRTGGRWFWADLEPAALEEMEELLGDEVRHAAQHRIPYPDQTFDYVLSVDVHEHVSAPDVFTAELRRVVRPGGRVIITVPGGNPRKLANRLKHAVGMRTQEYGHERDGFSRMEIQQLMDEAGIRPVRERTFSKFFTELIELCINFAYVRVMPRRNGSVARAGVIAPQTRDQLRSVDKTYRLYSLVYPFVWSISQLDRLLFFTEGYVVVVEGEAER
jgi:SAM-dependent methyltransferase